MFSYEVRIVVNKKNIGEFIQYCQSISKEFRKEKGHRALDIYQDTDQSNIYVLVSEWESQESMDQHLSGNTFSLLKGAAIVLGQNFKLRVGETKEKNYSQWKRLTLAWQTN